MPLGASLLIAILAIILLLCRKRKTALFLSLLHVLLLSLSSVPVISDHWVAKWERRFAQVSVEESPEAYVAVVLGGAVEGPVPPRLDENLGDGVDRVLRASRLYKQGKVAQIIVSGGNLPWLGAPDAEALVMKKLLVEWGVTAEAVLVEGASRTTWENAVNVRQMLVGRQQKAVLLVTSALHMPRAMAVFHKAGVEVIPSPTDFRVVDRGLRTAMDYLPDAGALQNITALVKEMVGLLYYRLNGWA